MRALKVNLKLPSHFTWIVLTSGFIACGGGSSFVSGAAGGKSSMGVGGNSSGGNVGSGGTVDNDAGVSTGGDTSAGGSSGYGSLTCVDLQTAYASELAIAKACTTGGNNTCVQPVLDALACGCSVFVSNTRTGALTNMDQIRGVWNSKKCLTVLPCTARTCVVPTSATCVASSTATKSGICTASTN